MLSGTAPVDGASLYYEVRGEGPALLMISGAGGDAGYYAAAAEELSDAFQVITYDRRRNSRSTGGSDAAMTIAEQARDAKAVIDQLAGGRALVFGNSGGAIIGLALAAAHPDAVLGLIAHEPPIVKLLPEQDPWRTFFDDILDVARDDGLMPAAGRFIQSIRGEGTYEWPADVRERFGGNLEYFFTYEFEAFGQFVPDEAALSAGSFPIVLAAGSEDRGTYYARPSVILAERLGVPWAEFPGYHLPFLERPVAFAAALRAVATQLISARELHPAG
jgi:pimeloyl-ACP methyl ester carboxylesterase